MSIKKLNAIYRYLMETWVKTATLCEIIAMIFQSILGEEYKICEMYQMIFMGKESITMEVMTFSLHVQSVIFSTLMIVAAYFAGNFFALLFSKLKGIFIVIVAVSIPFVLSIGTDILLDCILEPLYKLMSSVMGEKVGILLLVVLIGLIIMGIDWTLMRKSSIKSVK